MSNRDGARRPRTILVVSYYYPPSGGPGVQRVLKFTRYLPAHGYHPVILTVPEDAAFPMRDPTLAAEIPPEARVVRSPIREYYHLFRSSKGTEPDSGAGYLVTTAHHALGWRERAIQWIRATAFIPDGRMGWLAGGTRAGIQAARKEKAQLVFASGPPFTAHWIARRIASALELPLVLDFRDPWTRAPFYPRRPAPSRMLDERLERSCLERADAIVTVNQGIREDFLARYPSLGPSRFHVISNGFDPADFTGDPPPAPDVWILTHTGTLPSARFPRGFIGALRRLVAEEPGLTGRLRVRFLGRMEPELLAALTAPPLDSIVRFEGYRPHAESIRALRESRLLLLFIEDGPQARGILTGKLFEYLGSGAPILALAPEGEAAELIRRTRCGRVVPGDDVNAVHAALRSALDAFRAGDRPFGQPDLTAVAAYTRPALTERLAALFDALLEEAQAET